jgi:anaerobic nitric oxide reductase flavorubredoxin
LKSGQAFEGLWSIRQEGISYNTYLINDQKKAIIDLTKEMMAEQFLENVHQLVDLSQLDYIIINHMEPDHSGALRILKHVAPQAKILGTKRTQKMLDDFFGITEGVQVVQDGETLDLGTHSLRFISAPRVHWPETMFSYEITEKILFSCDAFGGYGALEGGIFDDAHIDLANYDREALRYFSNILTSFCKPVMKAIENLQGVPVSMVAPSHGLIWRNNPLHMVDLYSRWAQRTAEKGITLLYGTMYGNTEKMVQAVAQGISNEGVSINVFNVSNTHISYILPSLWTQIGVVIGAPTYERHIFPFMRQVLEMAQLKEIFGKKAAYFGSYGWGGGAREDFENFAASLSWDVVGILDFVGGPTQENLDEGKTLGVKLAQQVKAFVSSVSTTQ